MLVCEYPNPSPTYNPNPNYDPNPNHSPNPNPNLLYQPLRFATFV